jgi:hypothetical protein
MQWDAGEQMRGAHQFIEKRSGAGQIFSRTRLARRAQVRKDPNICNCLKYRHFPRFFQ